MSKKTFEYYVNYVITDAMISTFESQSSNKTSFSSLNGFCNHITNAFKAHKEERVVTYIRPMIDTLMQVFGMDLVEATTFVGRYFRHTTWEKYKGPVGGVRKAFNICF